MRHVGRIGTGHEGCRRGQRRSRLTSRLHEEMARLGEVGEKRCRLARVPPELAVLCRGGVQNDEEEVPWLAAAPQAAFPGIVARFAPDDDRQRSDAGDPLTETANDSLPELSRRDRGQMRRT